MKALTNSAEGTTVIHNITAKPLTTSQRQFLDFVLFQDPKELSASLKRVHDIALYFSETSLEEEEKSALYDLKLLAEGLEGLARRD